MIRAVKEPKGKREEAKIVKEECYRATIKRNTCQQNPNRNHVNGTFKKVGNEREV